jgi:co-chaperonin GroES (HSP10)
MMQLASVPLVAPQGNHILAEPIYTRTTKAGLELPEGMVKDDTYKPVRLRVLRTGPGRWSDERDDYIPMQYKAGDVVYPGGPGFKWDIDGRELWLIDAAMIVAVEEEECG